MRGVKCDGNDPVAMYRTAKEAVDRARAGEGPTLIEAMTFRMLGHLFGADYSYVPAELTAKGIAADPVPRFRQRLLDMQVAEADLVAIEAEVEAEIDEAVEFALGSDFPDASELAIDVYGAEQAA